MANHDKKIIVVIGATGNQGSSVAHTFLALPQWHVRCITRSPASPAALKLASLGAEIVQADLAQVSSLTTALANANAIFLNTDFWGTYRAALQNPTTAPQASEIAFEREVQDGKNAVDAAAAVPGLERLIYSALGPAKRHSNGRLSSYHWDSKAGIVDYISSAHSALATKTSFIYLGGYNTNPFFTPPLDAASNTYQFTLPFSATSRMPIIDPKISTGPFVRALVEDEKPGLRLLAYDQDSYITIPELVELWSRVTGKKAEFVQVSRDEMHAKFGIPMEILAGPVFIDEFGYMGGVEGFVEPKDLSKAVETVSFGNWLRAKEASQV